MGNTSGPPAPPPAASVHPHGRGEYKATFYLLPPPTGPSPRAWGIHRVEAVNVRDGRSIPTGVGNTHPAPQTGAAGPVHPHGRGEYRLTRRMLAFDPGPSPRAWGIRVDLAAELRLHRSIPTGVGNTLAVHDPRVYHAVHPHGRGEYCSEMISLWLSDGPSPRAWGIHPHGGGGSARLRSIPTGVGNTTTTCRHCPNLTVHPHGRGEYARRQRAATGRNGPSPRAWGILVSSFSRRFSTRSIPTGVGNTSGSGRAGLARAVHPHGRGEYSDAIHWSSRACGPSPRAWGIRPLVTSCAQVPRSIPTGVGNTSFTLSSHTGFSVHPHGRGEYWPFCPHTMTACGPSPRAWGILVGRAYFGTRNRSIPTGVGNTRLRACCARATTVHPHGRGEYEAADWTERCFDGPSPRAWGILLMIQNPLLKFRSIPTGVGNTACGIEGIPVRPVHPHGRGEYEYQNCPRAIAPGPSPRAWGILADVRNRRDCMRSIPTGVGNTFSSLPMFTLIAVHPHGRGEYRASSRSIAGIVGPSPRAWGIPDGAGPPAGVGRSIPTGVGNTGVVRLRVGVRPVHPHGRGEYTSAWRSAWLTSGPSPRAWGILGLPLLRPLPPRSIPTGVGNTDRQSSSMSGGAVHPHGRGEYTICVHSNFLSLGPSPRAWGIHKRYFRRRASYRSIPTGVGNTLTLRRSRFKFSGPSPRAWGILRPQRPRVPRVRSIPTGVGNTRTRYPPAGVASVHPHGRGEYDFARTIRGDQSRSIPTGVGNTPGSKSS